jgi:DNA-binding NarL/FixJ family response regulator
MRAYEFVVEARDPREDDPNIIKDVKDAYDAGYTPDDTAKLTGLSYASVMRMLKTHYQDRTRPSRKPKELDAVKAAWDSGLKAKQIADELGIPRAKVTNLLSVYYPERQDKSRVLNDINDLSTDEKNNIIANWQNGSSVRELALKYDINDHAMSDYIVGVVGRAAMDDRIASTGYKKDVLTQTDIENIVKLYQNGETLPDIARKYNVTGNNIRYHLMRKGVFVPARGNNTAINAEPALVQSIVDMHLKGMSVNTIAKNLNVSSNTVRYHLLRHGAL